jgi:hypothetical protein
MGSVPLGETALASAVHVESFFHWLSPVLRDWRSYHVPCEVEAGTLAPSPTVR